tara:strand:+ start:1957 stop:3978 length:2022 start_codon:yes stop_codon:yes gene_type:complete
MEEKDLQKKLYPREEPKTDSSSTRGTTHPLQKERKNRRRAEPYFPEIIEADEKQKEQVKQKPLTKKQKIAKEKNERLQKAKDSILDNKPLLGERLFDSIEGTAIGGVKWLQQQAIENPDRYTDDVLRLLGGGLKNTAWALSKIPLLNELAKGEDWLAYKARQLSKELTPKLDPRWAGWGTRIGTGILADKGIRKGFKVGTAVYKQQKWKDKAKQLGLIDKYKNRGLAHVIMKQIDNPGMSNQQARRPFRLEDFDEIIAKNPGEFTTEQILDFIKHDRAGRTNVRKTIEFLNKKSDPKVKTVGKGSQEKAVSGTWVDETDITIEEIAADMSVLFGRDITVDNLKEIIKNKGTITFQTESMRKAKPPRSPLKITNIEELKTAYLDRLKTLRLNPTFDKGHIFAVKSLLDDANVIDRATYVANLEPEMRRSIEQLVDVPTLEALIKGEDITYIPKVQLGNRSKKQFSDPDKIEAAVTGSAYGLEDALRNFVYPDQALANLIPPSLKDTFTDLFRKEVQDRIEANIPIVLDDETIDIIKKQVAEELIESFSIGGIPLDELSSLEAYRQLLNEAPEIIDDMIIRAPKDIQDFRKLERARRQERLLRIEERLKKELDTARINKKFGKEKTITKHTDERHRDMGPNIDRTTTRDEIEKEFGPGTDGKVNLNKPKYPPDNK